MKFLSRLVLLSLIGLPVAALVALWMCFQDAPLVARKVDISPADIERARRILSQHDPRKAKPDVLRAIVASQQDVDLVLNYAAGQLRRGSVSVALEPGVAHVQASLAAPPNPFGPWLNVDAVLRETGALPAFERLRIGSLPVPGFLADLALERLAAQLNKTAEGRLANDVVKSVSIAAGQVQVVYEWRDDIPDRVRAAVLPAVDQERFRAYSDRLSDEIGKEASARAVPLTRLLTPLFALARTRSEGGDAAKENRAAIVTLAFYVNGRGLAAIIPAAREWRRPASLGVTLNGRSDFPQHYLVSAAIAAEAGSPLADAIGLYKEVEDARDGSGFSFNDIAADRAGTRFGELAVSSPRRLQDALAAGAGERDIMPDVADLPEFMAAAEFKRRYGGVGAPGYRKMMAEIERRVGAVTLFR